MTSLRRHRRSGRPMRVFIGLSEVAGYYSHLSLGMQSEGVRTEFLTLRPHPFAYDGPQASTLQVLVHKAIAFGDKSGPFRAPIEVLTRLTLLLHAIFAFDSFVFGFRNSFLIGWDIPILRLFGKTVVSIFHGSDSRPPYLDPVTSRGLSDRALTARTKAVWRTCRRFERWSNWIVSNPLSSHFFEQPVVAFQHIGAPISIAAASTLPAPGPPKILHAPSDLDAKGTEDIRAMINDLREDGLEFDYVELIGRPNHEVVAEMKSASFVIDQLYSDTTLAGFATEAASLGRAAVVAGCCLNELIDFLGPEHAQLAAFATAPGVGSVVRQLITDPEGTRELGRRAQEFVHREWNRELVARRILTLISGHPHPNWLFDPSDLRCACGLMTPERSAELIRRVMSEGGRGALCLSQHPRLEQAVAAEGDSSTRAHPL